MTECLQNCKFYRIIISNYSSKVKLKSVEKLWKSKDFFAHYVEKTTYFEAAPSVFTIAYKKVYNLKYKKKENVTF